MDNLRIRAGDKILDLGTGSGYLAFPIAIKHPECTVTGIDIVVKALEKNREKATKQGLSNLTFESYKLYRLIHHREKEKEPLIPPDGAELYMAIVSPKQAPVVRQPDGATVKKVNDPESFALWVSCVMAFFNDDYQYIHPRHHYPACAAGKIRCYICYKDSRPTAVCSILDNSGICSLEFVATHTNYRRQGLAKYICSFAMKDTFNNGAKLISVRAGNPGIRELYTSLGFKIYNYAM